MIVDKIENAHLYAGLSEKIAKVFEILRDDKLLEKGDGRYDVDGDELYYMIQHYQTSPVEQGRLEAHRKYIDIQFVAKGEELLGFCVLDNLEIEEAYDEAKDCAFYKAPKSIGTVHLQAGMFCVLFPEDAHMPGRELNGPADVVKVVVKVKING